MDYQKSQDYINSLATFGIQLGLDNISSLLKRIGSPHQKLKMIIHVAGTNGKGSTVAFLNSILSEAGFKAGIYTSPHLLSFTERITINNNPISEEEVAKGLTFIRKNTPKNLNLTYFEIATTLAFHYFALEEVDIAIIEVGLGGRLDATNVVNSQIAVITNIDYEHKDWLGNSLAEIAYEKAGIIKENSLVVTGATSKEAFSVIEEKAKEKSSFLYALNRDIKYQINSSKFTVWGDDFRYQDLEIGLLGRHQIINAALVVGVVELLRKKGINISLEELRRGFKKAIWHGRAQILSENPTILLDGAHNPSAISSLRLFLEDRYLKNPKIIILGILKDKDVKEIVRELLEKVEDNVRVILCEPNCYRALSTKEIKKEVLKYLNGDRIKEIKNIREALKYAKDIATKNHLICVTGSLYMVAEALA
ncbi:MAG: folylpolyglutamate synthase/dihydrofolate synthase family protein [bacterium]|nr:folylpolyglutamate synthase/dihydrofolate synthase family protein [bacterium]